MFDAFHYSHVAIRLGALFELFEMFDGFDYYSVAAGLFDVQMVDGFDSQDQSGGTCTTDGSACGSHPLSIAAPCSCHEQTKQNKAKQREKKKNKRRRTKEIKKKKLAENNSKPNRTTPNQT